jgi:hypothetical protein
MARLKVKQISDFTTAVNDLISNGQVNVDSSIDSLESQLSEGLDSLGVIDSAVSNALSDEIAATDTAIGSLEVIDSAVSNALSTEIAATDTEIGSLEVIDSAVSNALSTLDDSVGNINIGSLEVIDSAISDAVAGILAGADVNMDNFSEVVSYINSVDDASDLDLVNEMASVDTAIGSLEVIDSAVSNALSTLDDSVGNINIGSLEVIDSAISNALSDEIAATDTAVGSLEVIDSAISNALSDEIAATDTAIGSLEVIDSAISNALSTLDDSVGNINIGSLEVIDSAISNALSDEIAATDTEITALQANVGSIDTRFDSVSKEPYVHGVVSDIVTGGGLTVPVLDNAGTPNADSVTDGGAGNAVAIFDLAVAIEGGSAVEHEANFVKFTINGLEIGHDALTFGTPLQVTLDYAALGYNLEATDVIEYKYIQD